MKKVKTPKPQSVEEATTSGPDEMARAIGDRLNNTATRISAIQHLLNTALTEDPVNSLFVEAARDFLDHEQRDLQSTAFALKDLRESF